MVQSEQRVLTSLYLSRYHLTIHCSSWTIALSCHIWDRQPWRQGRI
uniref:Uncharacterized protein n=1 Tax=Ascaris lumbricoides TaxID=6252 RepID=A0A0M3IBH0_ASCLU